jgi:CRP-like cAMP-binding protein
MIHNLKTVDTKIASSESPIGLLAQSSEPALRVLHVGDYLYEEADPRTCVYRVEKGVVAVFERRKGRPGRIIEMAGRGDYVALGCLEQHSDNARAVVETTVSCVPRTDFSLLAESNPKLRQKQAEAFDREFEYRKEAIRNRGPLTPVECVAAFLIAISRQNSYEGQDPAIIPDTIKCDFVTSSLGINIKTLGRALVELERMDLIKQDPSTGLRIQDLEALERIANGQSKATGRRAPRPAIEIETRSTPTLIDRALASPAGVQCLEQVETRLLDALKRRRFNTQSAIDLFSTAADRAVWTHLRRSPLRRIIYRNYLVSADGSNQGAQMARAFVSRTHATDQRPTRRWLRFLLGA